MEMVKLEPIKRSTLTASEVAEYLGVSIDTIYKLCREKKIVHFRIGSRLLFKKAAIENWIEQKMIAGLDDERA